MTKKTLITSSRRLDEQSLPYKLYKKANRFGTWNPEEINYSHDKAHWPHLPDEQKQAILRVIAKFQGGEEAVTRDLLPLIMVISNEGRIEEEMFLTTFLHEEAKHTEFFQIVLSTIDETEPLSKHYDPAYEQLFNETLPNAMDRLLTDQSPEAIADAATIYNMFVEGVLAESGYHTFYEQLQHTGMMPGLLEGVGYLKRDESRHIAYGTYLLHRIIKEHPHIYDQVIERLDELKPVAVNFSKDENGTINEDSLAYMMKQLDTRLNILKRAKRQSNDDADRDIESTVL
ncbi:ribonucleotide-diphosphate reductase [Bacillaceae bacterium JMAK1]|nr:ribonucleotide-diphosphate reductase [Bacillaceae bacterium JMAK1]